MWKMTSGIPAFNDIPHDFNLALNICQGLRSNIIEGTMPEYAELMKKCWDPDPNKSKKSMKYFKKWKNKYIIPHFYERILVSGK